MKKATLAILLLLSFSFILPASAAREDLHEITGHTPPSGNMQSKTQAIDVRSIDFSQFTTLDLQLLISLAQTEILNRNANAKVESFQGVTAQDFIAWIQFVHPTIGFGVSEYQERTVVMGVNSSDFYCIAATFPNSDIIEYATATGKGDEYLYYLTTISDETDHEARIRAVSALLSKIDKTAVVSEHFSKTILVNHYYFEPLWLLDDFVWIWLNQKSDIKSKDLVIDIIPSDNLPMREALMDNRGRAATP